MHNTYYKKRINNKLPRLPPSRQSVHGPKGPHTCRPGQFEVFTIGPNGEVIKSYHPPFPKSSTTKTGTKKQVHWDDQLEKGPRFNFGNYLDAFLSDEDGWMDKKIAKRARDPPYSGYVARRRGAHVDDG